MDVDQAGHQPVPLADQNLPRLLAWQSGSDTRHASACDCNVQALWRRAAPVEDQRSRDQGVPGQVLQGGVHRVSSAGQGMDGLPGKGSSAQSRSRRACSMPPALRTRV